MKLFLEEVLRPFEQAGTRRSAGPRSWSRSSGCARLPRRPLLAVFQQTMTHEVDSAFGKELARRTKRSR